MRVFRIATLVALASLIGAATLSGVRADEWDKTTKVTFNEAVQVPGMVLQPGTYTFKLADSSSNRHIVQIFNEDQTQLITQMIAINDYTTPPPDQTLMSFAERPIGQPVALKEWFYPGEEYGQEFVYPKGQETTTFATNETEQPPAETQPAPAPAPAPEPAAAPEQPQAAAPPPQEQPAAQPAPQTPPPAPAELPKTGSDTPLIGLAGLLALGGALALRGLGRQPS